MAFIGEDTDMPEDKPKKKRCIVSEDTDIPMIYLNDRMEECEEYAYIRGVVLGSIPILYVKTSSHIAVEKMVLDPANTQRITLLGPKGTGKTTCLVALWRLFKSRSKPVVFISTKAVKCFRRIQVKQYTHALTCNYERRWEVNRDTSVTDYISYMSTFIEYLCKEKKTEKVVLLIDLSRFNEDDDQLTMELADLAYLLPSKNLQVVVAFTSATGKFVSNEYVYSSIHNVLNGRNVTKIEFHGFNEAEASAFLQTSNCSFNFQQVKEYTGYNPSLLSLAVDSNTLHEVAANVEDAIIRFVNNNLPNHGTLKTIYTERLKSTDYFFEKAVNQEVLQDWELTDFLRSWVYKHHVCYIVEQNPCIIRLNFPLLPTILHKELLEISQSQSQQKSVILKDPTVQGIIFEYNFFHYFQNTAALTVYTNGSKQIKNFQCMCNTAYHDRGIKLERLTKGVIYQLRFGHPVIDGVGLLQDENEKCYLVFIQASISHYRDHKAKVHDLFKNKTSLPELQHHDTLFNHYKSIAKKSYSKFHCNNTIYVYISPKTLHDDLEEKDRLKLLKKHSNDQIKVGIMYKSAALLHSLRVA